MVAFSGQSVQKVTTSPRYVNELLAVVEGRLQQSLDGGILWRPINFNLPVRAISYDPVVGGKIYVGTDTGVYVSSNNGLSWRQLGGYLSGRKIVTALTISDKYVFASVYSGAGSRFNIVRFDTTGAEYNTSFDGDGVVGLAFEPNEHKIYAAFRDGIAVSSNEGDQWQFLGGARLPVAMTVTKSAIWETADDGLFKSIDEGITWMKLHNAADFHGLTGDDQSAYFGVRLSTLQQSYLGHQAGDVEQRTPGYIVNDLYFYRRLWVASENGLLVDDTSQNHISIVSRPLLVIPGILGSMPVPAGVLNSYDSYIADTAGAHYRSTLILDPILKTYDHLITSLVNAGYERGRTLFTMPYEWRQDNRITARQLATKIADIKQVCACTTVDIVAHSMGGLIARSYIQSNFYANDVANFFQVATPNGGALSAYAAYEAGDIGSTPSVQDRIKRLVLKIEAKHGGWPDTVHYIREAVPSIGQLLPVFDYIQSRRYPDGYPRNEFLEQLNQIGSVDSLQERTSLQIIGSIALSTPQQFSTTATKAGRYMWPHGEIVKTFKGPGDGTVLLSSLQQIRPADMMIPNSHGDIMSNDDLVQQVLKTLIFRPSTSTTNLASTDYTRYLLIYVQSPVRLVVTDSRGGEISDRSISINGGYYTGSDSHTQFAFIPNQLNSSYKIQVIGTGNGQYTVGVIAVDGATSGEYTKEQSGNAQPGSQDNFVFEDASHTFLSFAEAKLYDVNKTTIMNSLQISDKIYQTLYCDQAAPLIPLRMGQERSLLITAPALHHRKDGWRLVIIVVLPACLTGAVLYLWLRHWS